MSNLAKVHVMVVVEVAGNVRNDDNARKAAVEQWGEPESINIDGATVEWVDEGVLPEGVSDDD